MEELEEIGDHHVYDGGFCDYLCPYTSSDNFGEGSRKA